MALRLIPVRPSIPSSRRRVLLDGREYVIRLRWSMREEVWYLDLLDVDGEPLLLGRPLVANRKLLGQFRQTVAGLPPGEIFAADPRPTPADPGLDELGDVVSLTYEEAA
jgi:hypothetical protein